MKKVLISLFSVTALSFAACLDVRADEKDRRPVIFWASEPVRPGETAMVIGENLGDHPAIEIVRLPDGRAKEPLQENVGGCASGGRTVCKIHRAGGFQAGVAQASSGRRGRCG